MKVKIRYSVDEILTYSGVLEVDESDYRGMKTIHSDKALGEAILERVDRENPQNWGFHSLGDFELITS